MAITAINDAAAAIASPLSPLLSLPPELRNEIYRVALLDPNSEVKVCDGSVVTKTTLLRTCKAIREEATEIFWSEQAFRIELDGSVESTTMAAAWLQKLGGNATSIRKVTIATTNPSEAARERVRQGPEQSLNATNGFGLFRLTQLANIDKRLLRQALSTAFGHGLARDAVVISYERTANSPGARYAITISNELLDCLRW